MTLNNRFSSILKVFESRKFHFTLIAIGIILRLKHFLEFRSLWLDEAYVANMISSQSYLDFIQFKSFSADLASPPSLFLIIEKLFTDLLGNHDYVLRLWPLLCGIASILIFYKIIRLRLAPQAVSVALCLFALAEPLVYYSSELKPYSSDVFICLMLIYLAERIFNRPLTPKLIALLAIFGSISLLMSYPAVFVLIGVMIFLIISSISNNDFIKAKDLFNVGIIQASVFLYYYVFCLRNMTKSKALLNPVFNLGYLSEAQLFSAEKLKWLFSAYTKIFNQTAGLILPGLWALIFIIGIYAFYKKNRQILLLYTFPLLLAIFAAFLNKFPFGGRYLLFLSPILFLFVTEGLFFLLSKFGRLTLLFGTIILCLLLFNPVKESSFYLTYGRDIEQIRPLMKILNNELQDGDVIVLNTSATFGYFYYLGSLDFSIRKDDYVIVNDVWHHQPVDRGIILIRKAVFNKQGWWRRYSGKSGHSSVHPFNAGSWPIGKNNERTWILLNHIRPNLKDLVLTSLNNTGTLIEKHEREGTALFLYDLSRKD